MTNDEQIRKDAAAALGAKGGRAGTGAAKKRSKSLYKRLAKIKKVEKAIRLCKDDPTALAALKAQLLHLRSLSKAHSR